MDAPRVKDVDPVRKAGRERQLVACMATVNPEKAQGTKGEANENENDIDAMAESTKLTPALSGCVYMPPALLRTLKATAEHDRGSAEYRGLPWDALRQSTTGVLTQQGQHGQHQVCRLRGPYQRSWAFPAPYHEGTGRQLALYTSLCGPRFDYQHKTAHNG